MPSLRQETDGTVVGLGVLDHCIQRVLLLVEQLRPGQLHVHEGRQNRSRNTALRLDTLETTRGWKYVNCSSLPQQMIITVAVNNILPLMVFSLKL